MKSYDYRNDLLFLRNQQYMVGNHDMPFLYAQDIALDDIDLIAFSNTRHDETETPQRNRTIHFFLDDYKFDERFPDYQAKRRNRNALQANKRTILLGRTGEDI
jgi:hypothetical protein